MDFTNTTAEALLAHVPEHEDDRWEFKSSQLLDPQKKGDLKKELGKQVTAFANSGGGNIVFGIDEMPRSVRACPELVTRQSMQDYLSTMVEQSVEYPIRCFQVHRIPFEDASKGSIYLIPSKTVLQRHTRQKTNGSITTGSRDIQNLHRISTSNCCEVVRLCASLSQLLELSNGHCLRSQQKE